MKTPTLFCTILSVASLALATPLAKANGNGVDKRIEQLGVIVYKDANLENGEFLTLWSGICHNFTGDWDNNISSVYTYDKFCMFYDDANCPPEGTRWGAKGQYNTIPAEYNDSFSSVQCIPN